MGQPIIGRAYSTMDIVLQVIPTVSLAEGLILQSLTASLNALLNYQSPTLCADQTNDLWVACVGRER